MHIDQLEILDRVYAAGSIEDLYSVWKEFTEFLGYSKSAIMLFDWDVDQVSVTSKGHNWKEEVIEEYFVEAFFQFDLACNPCRPSGRSVSQHIVDFPTKGKPERVHDFWISFTACARPASLRLCKS